MILLSGVSEPEVDTANNQDRESVLLEACAAREKLEVHYMMSFVKRRKIVWKSSITCTLGVYLGIFQNKGML